MNISYMSSYVYTWNVLVIKIIVYNVNILSNGVKFQNSVSMNNTTAVY